jgi:hypothetical protein
VGVVLLGIGHYTRIIYPLPHSYRPAHGTILKSDGDTKLEAVRHIIAWIVEAEKIPGFDERYPDGEIMKGLNRFVVVCSFVPADAVLSNDTRVYRVDRDDAAGVHRKYGYAETDYISLSLSEESERSFRINLTNLFGDVGGHQYTFLVHETENGIVAEGKCEGVF